MADVTLSPNLPLTIEVKYLDVIGTKHGARLRVKGAIADDNDAKLWADPTPVLQQLVAIGACKPVTYDEASLPKKGVEVRLLHRKLVFLSEQLAGAKKGTIKVALPGQPFTAPCPTPMSSPVIPSEPASSGNPNAATREKRSALYKTITGFVLNHIVPEYKLAGIPCTAADIAGMVRTIYDGETRHA